MFWLFRLEKKICSCLCCFFCLGPILIIIGVALVVSSASDSRGALISKYNDAVEAWTSTHKAEFESLAANSVLVVNGNRSNVLSLDTSNDALNDDDKKFIPYAARKLVVSLNNVILPMAWNPYSGATVMLEVFVNNTAGPTIFSQTVQPMKTSYVSTTCDLSQDYCSDCTAKNGVWTSSGCRVSSVASNVCVKVDQYSSGNWYASSTPGGDVGCGAGGNWQAVSYTNVYNPVSPIVFNGQFVLRSAYDPYVVAASLTGGTFRFGLTTKEKIKYGFILIIIGGVCVVPAVLLGVFCYRHLAKKHDHHHHHHHYQPVMPGYGTYH